MKTKGRPWTCAPSVAPACACPRCASGAMMFGAWGNPDHDDCVRIVHAALDAGINFIDTADVYSGGESEEIVAKALAGGRRDGVILATKVHAPMGADANMAGNSRRWIMREVESSLRRLRTDWIDLYQIHRPDPTCDIDDTLGALSDLVHQGKVRAIGCSTFPGRLHRRGPVGGRASRPRAFRVRTAPVLDPGPRRRSRRCLPACQRYGMGVIVWSPLNGGWLTGRYRKDAPLPEGGRASRDARPRSRPPASRGQRQARGHRGPRRRWPRTPASPSATWPWPSSSPIRR